MSSGYLLLDQPNPNGPHFYTTRNKPLLAIVVHITAGLEDLDTVDDHSAEATAQYAATTSTQVSWHSGSDTDSSVYLLPAGYTAWHATAYNGSTYGHEISKTHPDWRSMSADWVRKTLGRAADTLRPVAQANGIPARKATRAELDREIANYNAGRPWQPVGYIGHTELQPENRRDPGMVGGVDTFPWGDFLGLIQDGDDLSGEGANLLAFMATGGPSTRVNSLEEAEAQKVDRSSLFGRVLDVQLALTAFIPMVSAALSAGVKIAPADLNKINELMRSTIDIAVDAATQEHIVPALEEGAGANADVQAIANATAQKVKASIGQALVASMGEHS